MRKKSKIVRKCIVYHVQKPLDQLIRIVKTKNGEFLVDSDAKGRGAYVSKDANKKLVKKNHVLHKSFKSNVPESVYEALLAKIKEKKDVKK